jgi:hypothetical protein
MKRGLFLAVEVFIRWMGMNWTFGWGAKEKCIMGHGGGGFSIMTRVASNIYWKLEGTRRVGGIILERVGWGIEGGMKDGVTVGGRGWREGWRVV